MNGETSVHGRFSRMGRSYIQSLIRNHHGKTPQSSEEDGKEEVREAPSPLVLLTKTPFGAFFV